MNPPSRILATTDLSAPARHAAARAAMLAAESGARLDLLHVIETGVLAELNRLFAGEVADIQARLVEQAWTGIRQLAAELAAHTGVTPAVTVAEGSVLAEIAARVEGLDAGLVVLGSHGANFMRHWLLGATAGRLLRRLRRPILAVRQVPHERYRSLLLPVDFSPWSRSALDLARVLAPDARLTLMHAYQVPFEGNLRLAGVEEERIQYHRMAAQQEAYNRLHALAAEAGLAPDGYRALVLHGDAASHILEQEEEQDADLIVMGKQGVGAFEELLLGSVTKHVLTEARCDVLIAQK
jgi:nucleotide-binding universal stress UspA family protein